MTILFYIACISITWFFTSHRDMRKLQAEVFHLAYKGEDDPSRPHLINYTVKNQFYHIIYELMTCAWCIGSWVGIIGTILLSIHRGEDIYFWPVVMNGLTVSILSVLVCKWAKE